TSCISSGTFFYKTNSKSGQRFIPGQNASRAGPRDPRRVTLKLPSGVTLLRRHRIDIYSPSRPIEAHVPVDQRKNSVVATKPDVFPWQKFCPPLPDNNVARHDQLASEFFHAQSLADAIAPVLYAALSFFVSHE